MGIFGGAHCWECDSRHCRCPPKKVEYVEPPKKPIGSNATWLWVCNNNDNEIYYLKLHIIRLGFAICFTGEKIEGLDEVKPFQFYGFDPKEVRDLYESFLKVEK